VVLRRRQSGHDKTRSCRTRCRRVRFCLLAYLPAFSLPRDHRVSAGALAHPGVDPDPGRASCLPPPDFGGVCRPGGPARAARPGL